MSGAASWSGLSSACRHGLSLAALHVYPRISRLLLPCVEFIVPPLCLCCGGRRGDGERGLCAGCWDAVTPVAEGDPVFQDALFRLSADGLVDGLCCGFVFEKGLPVQTLIHGLKYGARPSLGVDLGLRLGRRVVLPVDGNASAAIVPVPLHPARLRERGYNQSERIAAGLSRATAIPVIANLLRRRRHTVSQTALSVEKRVANVAGAFVLRRKYARRMPVEVLLVDDVITSGSTVRECARVLKAAGVSRVTACSVGLAR